MSRTLERAFGPGNFLDLATGRRQSTPGTRRPSGRAVCSHNQGHHEPARRPGHHDAAGGPVAQASSVAHEHDAEGAMARNTRGYRHEQPTMMSTSIGEGTL